MGRLTKLLIGGVAVASLSLAGCSSSSSDSADTAPESSAATSSDFCQEIVNMQQRTMESYQKLSEEGKLNDEAAVKQLQDQLVEDLKTIESSLPEDAPENVRTAMTNILADSQSGDPNQQGSEEDNLAMTQYLTEQCPELAASASEAPGGEETLAPASPDESSN